MPVPKPSAMFLDLAEAHAAEAIRICPCLAGEIRPLKWSQPGSSNQIFADVKLVFDFLQEAMATVLLAYTALDNAANEAIPADFSMADAAGAIVGRVQIEGVLEHIQTPHLVLPAITGKPSIETADPVIWSYLRNLKQLRDDIGHVHYDQSYTAPGLNPQQGLFSRLFAADLRGYIGAVEGAIDHYSPQMPTTSGDVANASSK